MLVFFSATYFYVVTEYKLLNSDIKQEGLCHPTIEN